MNWTVQRAEKDAIANPVSEYWRERFWLKVDVGLSDDCWHWKRSGTLDGYGHLRLRNATMRAHRVAFFLYNGYWPAPLCLHKYTCERRCCNPLHLREGDWQENAWDRDLRRWRL